MRMRRIFLWAVLGFLLGIATTAGAQILITGTDAVWDSQLTAPAAATELEPRIVVEYATGIWDHFFSFPEAAVMETEDTPARIIVEYATGIYSRPLRPITISNLCPGDLDNSGNVSAGDVAVLAGYFGRTFMSGSDFDGDLDDDGDSDGGDIGLLVMAYGKFQCLGPE